MVSKRINNAEKNQIQAGKFSKRARLRATNTKKTALVPNRTKKSSTSLLME
jgi:hypothetical protein